MPPPPARLGAALAAALISLTAESARADERLFTFSYQATTVPAGKVEFENWTTFKLSTPEDSTFKRVEFRHELEFGLTDTIQLDVYLADWSWTDEGRGSTGEFKYDDSAVVLKINHLNPATDGFGLASYHEVKFGDEILELENKLLLQKNIAGLVLVYNLTLEAAWEGHAYRERGGEVIQSAGVSYEITPRFFVGAEAVHEIPLPDWKTGANQNVFVGPNMSWRFGGTRDVWITGTALRQVTDNDGEPEWEFRIILGLSF